MLLCFSSIVYRVLMFLCECQWYVSACEIILKKKLLFIGCNLYGLHIPVLLMY